MSDGTPEFNYAWPVVISKGSLDRLLSDEKEPPRNWISLEPPEPWSPRHLSASLRAFNRRTR